MLLFLRKILFYILLATYLIITPYIIFYGLGYSVNPTEGEIYKTGLVSIITEPKGATVFIEDKKFSRRTPAVIGGLLPGQYNLRITRKGFEPLQKTIQIVAEKATRLEPVVLLSKKPDQEILSEQAFLDLLPKAGDFKLFVLASRHLKDLLKLDLLFGKKTPLTRAGQDNDSVQVLDFYPKKDGSVVLIKIQKQGKPGFFLYDLEREKKEVDLTRWIPDKVDAVEWDPKNMEFVYFLKDGQVTGVDLAQEKIYPVEGMDILGVGARQKRLYLLKKDFSFWQANARGENAVLFPENAGVEPAIFKNIPARFYQIELLKREIFQKELILFLSDEGALMSNWPPYHLSSEGVLGFLHSVRGDSEKIVFWTEREIAMLDFALKNEEEETLPPKILLYRSGAGIRQVFWAYDNTHVIFLDNDEIFLLEAGDSAPYLIREIGRAAEGTSMVYNDRNRTLYYLNAETRQLMRRKITE